MNDVLATVLLLSALIGLNHLAYNPRAKGRGWLVAKWMTSFAVPAIVIGFPLLLGGIELRQSSNYQSLEGSSHFLVDVLMFAGLVLLAPGFLATLLSLLTRVWLRLDAYLRRVGPKNFARNVGNLAWVVGKSGVKLYAMAVVAFGALHLVGLRNLVFLGLLKGTLDGNSAAGDRDDRRRQEGGRHVGASSAS